MNTLPLSQPTRSRHAFGQARRTVVQLAITAALVFSILIAATAVSMGVARASALSIAGPDASLIVALTLVSVAILGALSSLAVRVAARARN